MAPIPLEASRLKIWRAGAHVTSLQAEIAAYMARKPAHANIRPAISPKDAGMVYHEIVVTEAIPIHLSTIVADAIHNLRTSLDLLACELVGSEDAWFPFAKDADELEKIIPKCLIGQISPEVTDLVRSFEPYKQGNLALRGVHDLDIIDKHRELLPTHGRIRIPHSVGDPIIPSSGVQFDPSKTGVLTKGHVRASNWPLGENLPVTFDLTFPQEVPFAAQPLVPRCESLVEEFTGVIDAFESLCFGTVTKQLSWT